MTIIIWREKRERHLRYEYDSERDKWHGEDNMKMTLIIVKDKKRDSQNHENNIVKESVQKWLFEKLTKIKVQTQSKVREYQ